jgi:hypothetical protein
MKVKLDDYDVRTLVNGLYQQRSDYDDDTNAAIDTLILRLADISDTMQKHPCRKKKIPFEPIETRLIRYVLNEWRNRDLQAGKDGRAEAIGELMIRFIS